MTFRRTFAFLAIVAALPACGALIGIKNLTEGTEPDGGGDTDVTAADALAEGATDGRVPLLDGGTDGPCGDTTQSADHCGRCNHSCLGGMCKAGVCQPTPIATGQGEVSGIALDATYVYFASLSGNFVARVPEAGGAVMPIATSGVEFTRHIAVNATHVYWSAGDSPGTVSRCPLAGCSGAPQVVASPDRPMGIALDSTWIYWADRNTSELLRAPLGGGLTQHVADSNVGGPLAVAVLGSQLVWLADFSGQVEAIDFSADAGNVAIGDNGQSGTDLVLDSTFAYWGAAIDIGMNGHITRAPRSGAGRALGDAGWSSLSRRIVPTVIASSHPPLLFDYAGFPPHTYELEWAAPGAPDLAKRIRALLSAAGIESETETKRGFDHGVFVPLKVANRASSRTAERRGRAPHRQRTERLSLNGRRTGRCAPHPTALEKRIDSRIDHG